MKTSLSLVAQLVRIRDWVKNFFIFIPLVFSLKLFHLPTLVENLAGFLVFSLVTSSVYIFNDAIDANEDRFHPTKRNRPIAAGRITRTRALLASSLLGLFALSLGLVFGTRYIALAFTYIVLNVFYSLVAKKIILLDLVVIAAGFLLRVMLGGYLTDVALSHWILVCSFLLALIFAASKRRSEIIILGAAAGNHRQTLTRYSQRICHQIVFLASVMLFFAYSLYVFSPSVRMHFGSNQLAITLPLVFLGLGRYVYLFYVKQWLTTPDLMLLKDRYLSLIFLLWLAMTILSIYRF